MNSITQNVNNGKWRLHAITTDKFKRANLTFRFIMPKEARRTPLTKLMLAVLLRGSEKYPTVTDINKKLDELYDVSLSLTSASFGDKCVFTVACKMLDNRFVFDGDDTDVLKETIDVVSDLMNAPLLDQNGLLLSSYVESERKIAIDAVNSLINDQAAYAAKRCSDIMFEGSVLGISSGGDVDTLSSFTARELTENIEYFKQNALVECYYIGSEQPSRVAKLIGDNFDGFTACSVNAEYGESAFVSSRDQAKTVREPMDVSQTRIAMGFTCDTTLRDEDYFAMVLANEIFGGMSMSKLFMNVRERKSLCYYCQSSYKSATGTIRVQSGVAPRNCDVAIEEIMYQLDELKRGNVTDAEMEQAKSVVISGFTQLTDSPAATEAFLLRRLLAGVEQTREECIAAVNRVTREQIVAAANKIKLDTVYVLEGNECGEECDDE